MDRTRLTITLKSDLVRQVDRTVDGAQVRNRSHAIELLLGKALIPDTVPVLILAGGKLVRNGSGDIPKTLIKVRGEPVLAHTLKRLGHQGFVEIIISTSVEGEKKIREREETLAPSTITLRFTEQTKGVKGTAAALRDASSLLGRQTSIIQYGDVLADIDYRELLEFHRAHRALATLALTNVEETAMWGVATMQGSRIVDFTEKPASSHSKLSHLVNAGIAVLEPQAIDLIGSGSGSLEDLLFPRLAKEGRLYGYPFEGEWKDVGAV